MTWSAGHPDPRCALCRATPGQVRVRAAGAAELGTRAVTVSVRLIPATVGIRIEASGETRPGDRMAPCPSCTETDLEAARALGGAVLAVESRRDR